jgi:hypothetical protein
MKTVNFQEVVKQAAQETSKVMTAQLRDECIASGWSEKIANRVRVVYKGNKFVVDIPDSIKAEAENLEYGTPSTQPTAAIRRFSNRLEESEKFLLRRAKQLLGGAL